MFGFFGFGTIQIQHLLKLNCKKIFWWKGIFGIQIQHLLKLNDYRGLYKSDGNAIQIQHLLKLNGYIGLLFLLLSNSNTTLVKVKLTNSEESLTIILPFKYNTC